MKRVAGETNEADLFTKYLTRSRTADITRKLGFIVTAGRSTVVDTA